MNDPEPTPLPPDCAAARARWQRVFDEAPAGEPLPPEPHAADCPDCRAWAAAARRLLDGVSRLRAPLPPPDLADRLLGRVLRDQRRRRLRRRVFAVTAMAAGLLLAVWAGVRGWEAARPAAPPVARQPVPPPPPPPDLPTPPVPAAPSLQDGLARAGSDVLALARRTAGEAVKPTRLFVPSAPEPPEPWQPAVEPASQSFAEVRHGAVAGFEPVASSAKRAVNLFWRELPPVQ
jgi:hypothetical protein